MKTLSVTYEKPIEAGTAAPARLRLRVWHLLLAAFMFSLIGWGALFLLIDRTVVALHWIKP